MPPSRSPALLRVVSAIGVLACGVASASAQERPDWLNVRECGASGSARETVARTTAGSKQITVADASDFRPGQGVMVSRCNVGYTRCFLRTRDEKNRPLGQAAELRGYDGSAGSWLVYVLDIDGANPATFRWSDDLARSWKAAKVPITHDWQPLGGGTEIRFSRRNWEPGEVIHFHARDQLVTTIERIEGKTLTLRDAANRTVSDARLRHCDSAALQAAIDRAVKQRRNVFVPAGVYHLARGLTVPNASAITIEGACGEETVLDITEGEGACLRLRGGTEVNIRNFRMIGHTGMAARVYSFRPTNGRVFWAISLKACNAISIGGTERVLVENVHASRMSTECFYAQGPGRTGTTEPRAYTKSITYLRCSATDCNFNAFNNNDWSESTNILYCRIQHVRNCAWEGPGRFVRFQGNYVRNAGQISVISSYHRYRSPATASQEVLAAGQTILADNVFENGPEHPGQRAIVVAHGASQVVVRDNLFVNFNRGAIAVSGATRPPPKESFPAHSAVVAGNIIDLTCVNGKPLERTGIEVSTTGVVVADNQVYVRGQADPTTTGIRVCEPALDVLVHDNLIRNCGGGLVANRVQEAVTEVVDAATFLSSRLKLPMEWGYSHRYRGWNLAWLSGSRPNPRSVIDSFDPQTMRFRLREPHPMKVGDRFEVFPPSANWNIHGNTITGCRKPVVLDAYGSPTSIFRSNTITCGEATGVQQAIEVHGQFKLLENQITGYQQP